MAVFVSIFVNTDLDYHEFAHEITDSLGVDLIHPLENLVDPYKFSFSDSGFDMHCVIVNLAAEGYEITKEFDYRIVVFPDLAKDDPIIHAKHLFSRLKQSKRFRMELHHGIKNPIDKYDPQFSDNRE
jgi:hypothetical protein